MNASVHVHQSIIKLWARIGLISSGLCLPVNRYHLDEQCVMFTQIMYKHAMLLHVLPVTTSRQCESTILSLLGVSC